MKPVKLLVLPLALLGLLPLQTSGATIGVLAGSNVQAAIDGAAPGDTLLFDPGSYPEPLNFNKPLAVAPSGGGQSGQVQFLGAVTIQNTGTNSFQHAFFGAPVESIGATVTFLDSNHNAPVTAKGGKLTMKRALLTTSSPLVLTNGAGFEALRIRSLGTITSYAPSNAPAHILIVQSELHQLLTLNNAKVWLGYNSTFLGGELDLNSCDAVLIGNRCSPGTAWCLVATTSNLRVLNNLFTASNGIYLIGGGAELINNTISCPPGTGLSVASATSPVNLRGCIFRTGAASLAVTGPNSAALVFASYTLFSTGDPQTLVLTPFRNCLVRQDPRLLQNGLALETDSPCLNAGPPEAIYNNRDGTRNSMGYTGGPYLNPANYTNDNPMVFLLTGPQSILRGALTTIPITAAASAGH